ncbi:hypothetical protein CDEST_07426 [Colletotrichum destructivum]|uniref:Uncharacterized protein n=1 Tax=Colletotrichum destructivum TaxID=34406 RepID=A0AAX4IGK9_9PEZI|nr:hypothetical protein CDEST_07426 [Colletotrichum destructivum]
MAQQDAQAGASEVILPKAPGREDEDPRERINVMIDIFNSSLHSSGKADRGFYNEIRSAMHIIYNRNPSDLTISRPLTEAEKRQGQNGSSQMILVSLGNNHYRELDMICEIEGITYVVEAKNTKTSDQHQLRANVLLARQQGWGVMYVLRENKTSQAQALRNTFKTIPEAQHLPPLKIVCISDKIEDIFHDGKPHEISRIITNDDIFSRDYWEGELGRKISFSEAQELSRKREER